MLNYLAEQNKRALCFFILSLFFIAVCVLSSCGRRGPLELPTKTTPHEINQKTKKPLENQSFILDKLIQ